MKDPILATFEEYLDTTGDNVAAAILVLAGAISHKTTIDRASAENLSHELGLMLRSVAPKVQVFGDLNVEVDA